MASDSTGLGISPYAISVIAPIAKVSLMFSESMPSCDWTLQ
jgi:hypothetical protein